MADVSNTLAAWSSSSNSNSPAGSANIGSGLDDNLRELQGVIVRGLHHKGSDIASSTAPALGATEGFMHDITGTATITGWDTAREGIWKLVKFEGALTLTHNATNLILPGAANITTADGDTALFFSEGSGNWRCYFYFKAATGAIYTLAATTSLAGIVELLTQAEYSAGTDTTRTPTASLNSISLGTEVAATSGTSIDFTGIPAGTRRIILHFVGVSLSGTAGFRVRLGDAGGPETSGYLGSYAVITTTVASTLATAGFDTVGGNAANVWHGKMVLDLEDATDFTWTATHALSTSNTEGMSIGSGSKSLSAELTQVRLTTTNGSDTFDAGVVNISYER